MAEGSQYFNIDNYVTWKFLNYSTYWINLHVPAKLCCLTSTISNIDNNVLLLGMFQDQNWVTVHGYDENPIVVYFDILLWPPPPPPPTFTNLQGFVDNTFELTIWWGIKTSVNIVAYIIHDINKISITIKTIVKIYITLQNSNQWFLKVYIYIHVFVSRRYKMTH